MPELPEIETVKMQLSQVLMGQKLTKIIVTNSKVIKCDISKLVGEKIVGIERKGKVLLLDFGSGTKLGFHFKMTGQLIYEKLEAADKKPNLSERVVGGHPTEDYVNPMPGKHTRVVFYFEDGILYFNDQRLFGWIEINPKFIDKLGPEPFEIDRNKFVELIKKFRSPIKTVLMDQKVISGIGNIYANDALWEAQINPKIQSNKLTDDRLLLLFEKVKLVLLEGIRYGGSTAADAKYIDTKGLGGHYQDHFRVYEQEGKVCKRCGQVIEKFTLGGRGTYWCSKCQV